MKYYPILDVLKRKELLVFDIDWKHLFTFREAKFCFRLTPQHTRTFRSKINIFFLWLFFSGVHIILLSCKFSIFLNRNLIFMVPISIQPFIMLTMCFANLVASLVYCNTLLYSVIYRESKFHYIGRFQTTKSASVVWSWL